MKTSYELIRLCPQIPRLSLALSLTCGALLAAHAAAAAQAQKTIPWEEIGAQAGAAYRGDGLAVARTTLGAHLQCRFQRLEAQATPEGLWLSSTVTTQPADGFRVTAVQFGRVPERGAASKTVEMSGEVAGDAPVQLPRTGTVALEGQTVRFLRPGLVEEYSVSIDGVRQDFVVGDRPRGEGDLRVQLEVAGAQPELMRGGVCLVLPKSGRKLAYNRLRATDATGRELPARMELGSASASAPTLAVVVDERGATYPIRIDPTFSDANWMSVSPFAGAYYYMLPFVYAAVVDDSGNLYIGGEFTIVGSAYANCIAKWDGSTWSSLGTGMSGGQGTTQVNSLAVMGTNLYAGGNFATAGGTSANNIACWDGTRWSALGSGVSYPYSIAEVGALAVCGTNLYVGGSFTKAGEIAANNIARWDGRSWSPLGAGVGDAVDALAVSGGTMYVGGFFTSAGGSPANRVAQWDGTNWTALGTGMNNIIYALALSGTNLFAGGSFTTAGDLAAGHIAQWNGSAWSALGSGIDNSVYALAVSGTNLYAGGPFTTAGGVTANYIARWDGSAWSALGSQVNDYVFALAVSGNVLYAGGEFLTMNGAPGDAIAQWNGSSWSALGSPGLAGANPPWADALAVSGSTLYAAGTFAMAGGKTVNNIAQWNGTNWSPVGSGLNNNVDVLALSADRLYAGGEFTTAGGNPANHIAQWNGSAWSALGSGMDGPVYALAVWGTNLYAGGSFTNAGGVAANHIAQWNGSTWLPLGSGMDGSYVTALAVYGTNLYAGGWFTTAGGTPASYIARWDGSSWSAVGSGMNERVFALAASSQGLYAGGNFTTAGGAAAAHIARWDGNGWSPLGSGIDGYGVYGLAASGNTVYAGGWFSSAGGSATGNIAAWDGSSWLPLGSGTDNQVDAVVVSGSTLYVAGPFTKAGAVPSCSVAAAGISAPTIVAHPQSRTVAAGGNAGFSVSATGSLPLSFQWLKNIKALADGGKVSGAATSALAVTNVYVQDPGYYQVVVGNAFGSTTSSNAVLTVSGLPLLFSSGNGGAGFANQQFQFTLAGPAGSNAVIYASTNLQTWFPLVTNLLDIGSLTITDATAASFPCRFYRAELGP